MYPVAFAEASHHLIWQVAGINTVILISSSFTMALAVYGAQTGLRKFLIGGLLGTVLLGTTFPGLEFKKKGWKGWKEIDVRDRDLAIALTGPPYTAATEEDVLRHAKQEVYLGRVKLFYSLYFIMTGLHATHMIAGLGILVVLIVLARRGHFTPEYHPQVELTGLYWHFVDVVWIFLLPLLYLIG
jgi:cytochrome c oxidase subunit 3